MNEDWQFFVFLTVFPVVCMLVLTLVFATERYMKHTYPLPSDHKGCPQCVKSK